MVPTVVASSLVWYTYLNFNFSSCFVCAVDCACIRPARGLLHLYLDYFLAVRDLGKIEAWFMAHQSLGKEIGTGDRGGSVQLARISGTEIFRASEME